MNGVTFIYAVLIYNFVPIEMTAPRVFQNVFHQNTIATDPFVVMKYITLSK